METHRSQYLLQRQELLKGKLVPTISRMRQILGKNFSRVFIEQCSPSARQLLGAEPLLKGVTGDLWTSPSDLLIGKVCLKPPLTSKHIKALTHKGILQIGTEIEKKYWNEMEMEKEHALKVQENNLQAQFDIELRNIGISVQKEERARCSKEMKKLQQEFEENLQMELEKLEEKLNDTSHINALLAQQKEMLDAEWQQKLDEAVKETVTRMTEMCLEEMKKQELVMLQSFQLELKEAEIKKQCAIEEEHAHCRDAIKQLRHQLECKNISNMMYILCMERRKCKKERDFIFESYQKHVNELNRSIEQRDDEIDRLGMQLTEKEQTLQLREECLRRILQQYQKFIYYALKATPTQAEFLLNIEKLLMYELADTLVNKKQTDDDDKWVRGCGRIIRWNKPKENAATPTNSHDGLTVKDHHNCFEEADLPRHLRPETDQWPHFYYNSHLYVREDFRNRFSQEIHMSPSHVLWNEDVESLMNILRQSVEDKKEIKQHDSSISKQGRSRSSCASKQTSNVKFSFSEFQGEKPKTSPTTSQEPSTERYRRKSSLRYSETEGLVDLSAVGKEEDRKTILSTKNSLELIRRSSPPVSSCVEVAEESLEEVLQSLVCIEAEKVDIKSADVKKNLDKELGDVKEKEHQDGEKEIAITENTLGKEHQETFSKVLSFNQIQNVKGTDEIISVVEPEFLSMTKECKPEKEANRRMSVVTDKEVGESMAQKVSKLAFTRDSLVLTKEHTMQNKLDTIIETKVLVAKDSLTLKRGSLVPTESLITEGKPRSCLKLSGETESPMLADGEEVPTSEMRLMHVRDSVEILRESKKNLQDKDESLKHSKHSTPYGSEEKLVQSLIMNGVEEKGPMVVFDKKLKVCDFDKQILPKMYSAIAKPEPMRSRDNFLAKKNELNIVGDVRSLEYKQTAEEFTTARITSFINLIKDNSDLIGMFTSFNR